MMRRPSDRFLIKYHVAVSVATLVWGLIIVLICLLPSFSPGMYRILVDDRIALVIPYLLFIALGESMFSIWYFYFRK
jgi:hypothetical protein